MGDRLRSKSSWSSGRFSKIFCGAGFGTKENPGSEFVVRLADLGKSPDIRIWISKDFRT